MKRVILNEDNDFMSFELEVPKPKERKRQDQKISVSIVFCLQGAR